MRRPQLPTLTPWIVVDHRVKGVRYVYLHQPTSNGRDRRKIRADILARHIQAVARAGQADRGDIRATFGARIRELRTERDLSQDDLGKLCRVHWSYISSIEPGRRSVGLDLIDRLAVAFGVHPSKLLEHLPVT